MAGADGTILSVAHQTARMRSNEHKAVGGMAESLHLDLVDANGRERIVIVGGCFVETENSPAVWTGLHVEIVGCVEALGRRNSWTGKFD